MSNKFAHYKSHQDPQAGSPSHYVTPDQASALLRQGNYRKVPGMRAIQAIVSVNDFGNTVVASIAATAFFDGPIGVGNALPFYSRTDATKKHHYEIPAAGDRTSTLYKPRKLKLRQRKHARIRVSSRNLFAQQSLDFLTRPAQ